MWQFHNNENKIQRKFIELEGISKELNPARLIQNPLSFSTPYPLISFKLCYYF